MRAGPPWRSWPSSTCWVGGILAFVGAVQLRRFGADVYVANLVGVAVVREMAALMTAIVMAGRTGGAYAAEIASMQGSEELDALRVVGIAVPDYLVLPRVLALTAMMPLLYLYGSAIGIFGGFAVSIATLHLAPARFVGQLLGAVSGGQILFGLGKSVAFGLLIGIAGCRIGLKAGRECQRCGTRGHQRGGRRYCRRDRAGRGLRRLRQCRGVVSAWKATDRLQAPKLRARDLAVGYGAKPVAAWRFLRCSRGLDLRDHGWQRLWQEHAAQGADRPVAAECGERALRRGGVLGNGRGAAGGDRAPFRRAVPGRRAVELDDRGGERFAAVGDVHVVSARRKLPHWWM